jgi:hypothetical protein
MLRFFYPKARVTVLAAIQPIESIAISTSNPASDDLPLGLPLFRRQHNHKRALAGCGIVHVSIITGERHEHGELEEVQDEPGMVQVVAEEVRPQRPLNDETYRVFVGQIHLVSGIFFQKWLIRTIDDATQLRKDASAVVASYL